MDTLSQRIFELEAAIIARICKNKNGVTVHFRYSRLQAATWGVDVVTRNPVHKAAFLLHSQVADSIEQCLEQTLTILVEEQPEETYTVVWGVRGATLRSTSFFRGRSFEAVMTKFYSCFRQERDKLVVWSATLSPES